MSVLYVRITLKMSGIYFLIVFMHKLFGIGFWANIQHKIINSKGIKDLPFDILCTFPPKKKKHMAIILWAIW